MRTTTKEYNIKKNIGYGVESWREADFNLINSISNKWLRLKKNCVHFLQQQVWDCRVGLWPWVFDLTMSWCTLRFWIWRLAQKLFVSLSYVRLKWLFIFFVMDNFYTFYLCVFYSDKKSILGELILKICLVILESTLIFF